MKVLCLDRRSDGTFDVTAGVDSAVLRPGEPVFVPEPVSQWRSAIVPVIRISRLGMSIRESRARNYYHEAALFHMLTPACPDACEGLPPYILDRAFSPGEWLDISDAASDAVLSIGLEVAPIASGESPVGACGSFSLESLGADAAVALLSRHLTFKTGDLLVFTGARIEAPAPRLDTCLTATLDGKPNLSIRIK